jgi:hypothetical protein
MEENRFGRQLPVFCHAICILDTGMVKVQEAVDLASDSIPFVVADLALYVQVSNVEDQACPLSLHKCHGFM